MFLKNLSSSPAHPSTRSNSTSPTPPPAGLGPSGHQAALQRANLAGLQRLPRRTRADVRTRATAYFGPPAGDGILLDSLVWHGLAMPPGHPGLGLNATVEVRAALEALRNQPRARASSLPALVREICIDGTSRALAPALCLMRHGLIDPNGRDHEGKTVLHAIAARLDDGLDYAAGYPTVAKRVAALVEVGADVHATCHLHELTALDYAVWREADVVIDAFVSAGAASRAHSSVHDDPP